MKEVMAGPNDTKSVRLAWWKRILLLFLGAIAGFPASWVAVQSWAEMFQTSGRNCPEGWLGVAIGTGLLITGIAFQFGRELEYKVSGALLAGFGTGFILPAGFMIFLTKVMSALPSC